MICAPIIIPTLNRVNHLARLLDSLKQNTLVQYTDVYIGLDFPPSSQYEEGYSAVSEYLKSDFSYFRSFNVIKRTKNLGYLDNVNDLIERVLQNHDRFIYMDDDLEVSPNFLEYMNQCLDIYENRKDIIAVCGYSYPLMWRKDPKGNVLKVNFNCSMWGTGFWKSKYLNIYKFIKNGGLTILASSMLEDNKIQRLIDVAKYEFLNLCLVKDNKHNLIMNISDISLRLYMALMDKWVLIPSKSKVRNWGFDGSGVYCPQVIMRDGKITSSSYDYKSQEIDQDMSFEVKEDTLKAVTENKKLLNWFDVLPVKYKIRLYIKLVLLKLLGVKNYIKLFS